MRLFSLVFAVNVAVAQELVVDDFSAVLFFDFALERVDDTITKIQAAAARIPAVVFVAGVLAAEVEKKVALTIMTKKNDANAGVVETWIHSILGS